MLRRVTLTLALITCLTASAVFAADTGDLARFIRIWNQTHATGQWDGVGDLVPDGVLDHKDAQAFAEAHTQGLRVFTTLQGKVTDVDGLPVYGATVTAGTPVAGTSSVGSPIPGVVSAQTAQDGTFSLLVTRLPGNLIVTADAPGYEPKQSQVAVSGGTKPLSPVALTSRNAQRLTEIASPTTQAEVKAAFEGLALAVENDPEGRNLADCHMAAVWGLLLDSSKVTVADLAAELALQGLKIDGGELTAQALANVLQAFVNVAYERPNDPRVILAQYLVADETGRLPAQAPAIGPDTVVDPVKAGVFFEAFYLAACQPQPQVLAAAARVRTAGLWQDVKELGMGIAGSLVDMPTNITNPFESEEAAYKADGELIGAVAGVGLCFGVAGILAATGVGVTAIPYLVSPTTLAVSGAVGEFIGGRVAMWLYKSRNKTSSSGDPDLPKPGDPVSEQHAAQIVMNLSGYVVPRSSLPITSLQWVWVPPGEFMMGADDLWDACKPIHRVRITKGFYLSKYEVTNAQYAAFLNAHGSLYDGDGQQMIYPDDNYCKIEQAGGGWRAEESWENHPVVCVTWYGAKAYCDHYGLRLPTEAEWEYAARGAEGRNYPWGNTWDHTKCVNWYNRGPAYDANTGPGTMAVGSIPAGDSWCGASDMAGNVWEWCADWWDDDYYDVSPVDDPAGPATGKYRLLRGGSWYNYLDGCRSAYRYCYFPFHRYDNFGFRAARTP